MTSRGRARCDNHEAARTRLGEAIKAGLITRPDTCPNCGETPGPNAAGNSQICARWPRGYLDHLDVEWRCYSCQRHGDDRPRGKDKRQEITLKTTPPPTQSGVTVRLRSAGTRDRSVPDPLTANEIYVSGQIVGRSGAKVMMPVIMRRIFLALACRQHAIVSRNELIELLWGDEPDGGPECADKSLDVAITALRDAGAALGFRIDCQYTRGYVLVPITYREMSSAA